jgi:hypothetical protein
MIVLYCLGLQSLSIAQAVALTRKTDQDFESIHLCYLGINRETKRLTRQAIQVFFLP